MKICVKCKVEKDLTDFYPSSRSADGRHYYCKICSREVANIYASKKMPIIIERAKKWYADNKDRKRAYDAKRRMEKRDLYRAASKRCRQNNPGKKNADTQLRRAKIAERCPPWVNGSQLIVFYESAARVTQCLGVRHCVDHVFPLRGRTISGLHVPANLRVVPERVNLFKSNHFSISPDGVTA